MRISEVTIKDLKDYCRVEDDMEDNIFEVILCAGKQFIISQTGLAPEECDNKADLTIALMIFCCELYENRSYTMSSSRTVNVSPAVDFIISQYRMNLL